MIDVPFRVDTKYGQFSDCLHLPDDHNFTESEIEAMKQQRVTNWINYIENPPPVVEEVLADQPIQE